LDQTSPAEPVLDSLLRELLARGFRSTLHRLRGLRGLLGGWIELGVPPGSEGRVQMRLEEDMVLLARLDWIGTMLHQAPPLKRLEAGEAPAVLLSAALGLGTPEEARERLPQIVDPAVALGLALWLQAVAPDGMLDHDLHLHWQNRSLVVECANRRNPDLNAWSAACGPLVSESSAHRIVLHAGALLPREELAAAAPSSG